MVTQSQLGSGGQGHRWDLQGWMGAGWGSARSHPPSSTRNYLCTSSSLTCHLLPLSLRAFILPSVAPSSPSSSSPSSKSPSPHWDEAALVQFSPTPCAPARSQRGGGQGQPRMKGNPHPAQGHLGAGDGVDSKGNAQPHWCPRGGVLAERALAALPGQGKIGIRSHPLVPELWLHQPRGD